MFGRIYTAAALSLLPLLLAGCMSMVPDALRPAVPKPNPDVASWSAYTLGIGGVYVTLPFCQNDIGWPLAPSQEPGSVVSVDMSRLRKGGGRVRLGAGTYEWNLVAGLPAFEFVVDLAKIDKGAPGSHPFDRWALAARRAEREAASQGHPDSLSAEVVQIGGRRWLLAASSQEGKVLCEAYSTNLTEDCCLVLGASYWPHPRPTDPWLAARRRMVREVVERVRISAAPPRPQAVPRKGR